MAAFGASIIAAIVGFAAYDIVHGYRTTVDNAVRELDSQARVVAEQTARSVQAIDVVLRHLVQQHDAGAFAAMSRDDLHQYLKEQTVGLVQTASIAYMNADGTVRATSRAPPAQLLPFSYADDPLFRQLREARGSNLSVDGVRRSRGDGSWVFLISRRLVTPSGAFDGTMTALGRVEYFQRFYQDAFPEPGAHVSLMHRDSTLLARFPPEDAALGQRFPAVTALAASSHSSAPISRMVSPLDGIDRLGATHELSDYPLIIVVSRDASVVLAGWREQAIGSALRTLVLASFAALLMAVTLRQLGRLDAARSSLMVSQERYALAAAGSDDGIWDWDLVAGIGYESQRARELQGLPVRPETQALAELQQLPGYDIEDAKRRRQAMREHLEGTTPAFDGEYQVQHADAARRWIHVRGLCIRDAAGRPLRIAGSVSDIDSRKRAEEALRRSEERFQLAVEGSNEGLWDWDMVGDMLFMSPRAQQLAFGESGVPLRPRREWNARSVYHPDDVEPVRREIIAHLRGETPHFTVEFRLRQPSGDWRWCRQRGIALRDDKGRAYRMAGSVEDITARKNATSERERLEQQLRQAQKLEAIGTLAGGIAHDFNNILAAILGYGELAQKNAPEGTTLRRNVDAALAAGARAKSLVERILAFSRSGMGERVPVHVQSVVAEALDSIAATLPPGIQLKRRLAAGDAGILGDATQIHQVVMNLCANSVQAMTPPGVLAVSVDVIGLDMPLAVATSTLAAGRYLRLAVHDSGCGIDPRLLERIFDPFFTTKDIGVGTGLGLSLVHGIVTDLSGGIAVDSKPGVGSVFTVYLATQSYVAPPRTEPQHVAFGDGETILFVDDEKPLVHLGEETLASLGYEPVGFFSSSEALEAFRSAPHRFDLVLSDEAMPGMTGSELAGEVRALRPDIPIVLMSGFVSPALVARAREVGVVEVVSKPLAASEVARCLAVALGKKARVESLRLL